MTIQADAQARANMTISVKSTASPTRPEASIAVYKLGDDIPIDEGPTKDGR